MSKADIERNAEICEMKKQGAKYKEIHEWFEVSESRAQQIYYRFRNYGNTKEEIIQNWEKRQEEKRKQWEESEAYREKRSGGREYAIRNDTAEVFLSEITGTGGDRVYRYGTKDIREALFFTMEEAKKIARERRAVVCWVP